MMTIHDSVGYALITDKTYNEILHLLDSEPCLKQISKNPLRYLFNVCFYDTKIDKCPVEIILTIYLKIIPCVTSIHLAAVTVTEVLRGFNESMICSEINELITKIIERGKIYYEKYREKI